MEGSYDYNLHWIWWITKMATVFSEDHRTISGSGDEIYFHISWTCAGSVLLWPTKSSEHEFVQVPSLDIILSFLRNSMISMMWMKQDSLLIIWLFPPSSTVVWTQGLVLARQVLYNLSHSSSPQASLLEDE
jgi:hypothetical protein